MSIIGAIVAGLAGTIILSYYGHDDGPQNGHAQNGDLGNVGDYV